MKKLMILLALSAAVAVFAGPQTPAAAPKTINCAVVKNDPVEIAKATKDGRFADYRGRRYFFCCDGCKPKFLKNPNKYKNSPSIPTPKPPKKPA